MILAAAGEKMVNKRTASTAVLISTPAARIARVTVPPPAPPHPAQNPAEPGPGPALAFAPVAAFAPAASTGLPWQASPARARAAAAA